MKYKLLGIGMLLLIIFFSFAATAMEEEEGVWRVHQHQSARGPQAGCDCDGGELCTHLPLVVIETGGKDIPGVPLTDEGEKPELFSVTDEGEDLLPVKVSIMDNEDQNHHPSDRADKVSQALIRVRGNSSRYFDKLGYLVRFTDEKGEYQDLEVMGMDAHYEWALHGPFLDKSLIRNYMWYNIAGEMMDYAPNVRFCEVIIDGAYQGLYVMTETITRGREGRLPISEPIDNTDETGYVLRLDRGSANPLKNIYNFTRYTYQLGSEFSVNIVYPRSGALTKALADAIEQDFSDFEKALYSFDYNTYDHGYQTWLDPDSFADYFIINEFTQNYDAGQLSTYLYKDIGGRYRMVIWDFNSACNNYMEDIPAEGFWLQNALWMKMLMRDEDFNKLVADRYRMWREDILSEEYLTAYIDETVAFLGPAIERNFSLWGYTFADYYPLQPGSRNPLTYEQAVEQMKSFIRERGDWMDRYIDVVQQYGHPSAVKKYDH